MTERSSAVTVEQPYGWAVERPGDPTFPRLYLTEQEANRMVAFISAAPNATAIPLFNRPAQGTLDPATVEACAMLVEQQQETIRETSDGSERYLAPRKAGNQMGLAYVTGIRALALSSRSPALESLIREYARDLRRNSSGGDDNDYPWEWAKATADYLEILIERASAFPSTLLGAEPSVRAPPQPAPDALREACKSSIKRIDELLHDNDCDGAHKELHELAYQFEMLSTPVIAGDVPAVSSHDRVTPE